MIGEIDHVHTVRRHITAPFVDSTVKPLPELESVSPSIPTYYAVWREGPRRMTMAADESRAKRTCTRGGMDRVICDAMCSMQLLRPHSRLVWMPGEKAQVKESCPVGVRRREAAARFSPITADGPL
ncbi:MAG: hypothetical protein JWO04_3429 [Gammaproteobacteria bacterium]|nr:hypothetical protein [Gammaproteobacteria bacterium]